jgi:hypothetical protein
MSRQMRLPNTAHSSRPWRIHELTRDFRLEDVWALPGVGGPDDFPRLVELITAMDPSQGSSRAARTLWAISAGRWGSCSAGTTRMPVSARVLTLRDRLPADLREAPTGPTCAALPFSSLYLLEDEWAAEIANRTMHGVLHIGRVPGRNNRERRLSRSHGGVGEAERTTRKRLHGDDQAVPAPDRVSADDA